VEGVGGEVFQIATNAETTVSEMVEKLIPALVEAGVEEPEVRKTAPRQGDVMRNFSDTSKAARLLGWKSETDLDTGLRRTVQWFMASNATPNS
jgi:UDP-glucose 4-epimerase